MPTLAKKDVDPHHFHTHVYGDHVELTFHIRLDHNMPLIEAHEIATMIETEIRNKYGYHSTIHIQPFIESSK